jgi:hypothetical protein
MFGNLLAFVYHCFDRIVIHGYLSGLSRPEQVPGQAPLPLLIFHDTAKRPRFQRRPLAAL